MKKYFLSSILSAAVLFASCGVNNEDLSGNTETSGTSSVTSQITETTSEMQTSETTTAPQTSEATPETTSESAETEKKDPETFIRRSPLSDYYNDYNSRYIKIPLSYEGREIYPDNACREVVHGLGYEDFPAKEDIAPAIEFAFENYFKGTLVYYMSGDSKGEPCTIDCLSFDKGLYMDFDGDGENESIIAIETDSEVPFTGDSTIVYVDSENGPQLLDEIKEYSHGAFVIDLLGLVYNDRINLITETGHGNSPGMRLYTYNDNNDSFDAVWGDSGVTSERIAITTWHPIMVGQTAPIRLIWDPEKRQYEGIGTEEISYEKLIEEVPEMELLYAEIERYYGKKPDSIETTGGLNFYFNFNEPTSYISITSDGTYTKWHSGYTVGAYIEDGFIRSDIFSKHYDYDYYYEKYADDLDNDIAYGLFLTYALPAE